MNPLAAATEPARYNAGMKVALIGSHGVGKTTLCFELAARLKRRGFDVDIVREIARGCPLPINQETTREAQEWILHTQIAAEIEASARHELVLCDRAVIDNYCYLVQAAGASPEWESMLDRWLPTYDLLVHVPVWTPPAFDGVRAVEPGFQQQIELLLEGILKARDISVLRLEPGGHDRWGRHILDAMLPVLEPTLPLFSTEDFDL